MAFVLPYLLLAHLILGAVAAGALTGQAYAAGLAGAEPVCTVHTAADPQAPADGGHKIHCVLCPLGGMTPLLPTPFLDPLPAAAPGLSVDLGRPRALGAPAPTLHEHARPRAPPGSASA
ncbi:MAG: hypothetical protein AB1592_03720 [Pseudomonadota bacterium]